MNICAGIDTTLNKKQGTFNIPLKYTKALPVLWNACIIASVNIFI